MLSCLTLLSIAAAADIQSLRISNRLIVSGLFLGCFFQVFQMGAKGIGVFLLNASLPVVLFYLLFLMRALGAGDIKLFSMIGGIWDLQVLMITIAASFLVAAAMSFCKILYYRNFISCLRIFREYIEQAVLCRKILKYPQESQGNQHIIHFSIAILIGYAIAMEVTY